ncbi:MAG: DUF4143 domain-containing protein [Gammaproteobacteria bacterium]
MIRRYPASGGARRHAAFDPCISSITWIICKDDPKVYVRDSGIVHALLGIPDHNALAGHPVVGASFEGFALENLLAAAPTHAAASFYRTAAGAAPPDPHVMGPVRTAHLREGVYFHVYPRPGG